MGLVGGSRGNGGHLRSGPTLPLRFALRKEGREHHRVTAALAKVHFIHTTVEKIPKALAWSGAVISLVEFLGDSNVLPAEVTW